MICRDEHQPLLGQGRTLGAQPCLCHRTGTREGPCLPKEEADVCCQSPRSTGFFQGKNIGVSCHFHFQGIFLTQGSNLHLLHGRVNSLTLSHLGSQPYIYMYPFSPRLPSHLGWHIALSSFMCCTVGLCWSSVLNIAVCTLPFQTACLSLPPHPSQP